MKENILDFKITLIGALAVMNMYLTSVFGAFTSLAYLVCGLMVADLITRAYAAGRRTDEKVQSKKVIEGIYRKLGMVMLIILSLVLDYGAMQLADGMGITIASKIIFTALTLAWIFVREFISNLENLQHAGIELPGFITKALNIAKDKVDKLGDSITGGEVK